MARDRRFKVPLMVALVQRILPYLAVTVLLYLANLESFLLFHTSVEIFITIVAVGMFMLVWGARRILRNQFLILLSVGFLFVGLINIAHLTAYRGMQVFSNHDETLSTQLWIAERFLLAVTFILALLFRKRKFKIITPITMYAGVAGALLASVFIWQVFPATYTHEAGVTSFKVASELVIAALFLVGMALLYQSRTSMEKISYRLLMMFLILSVVAELVFTANVNPYDPLKVFGHMVILFSYYLIYKAVIETGLTRPYQTMFGEIEDLSRQKDELLNIVSHEIKNPLTSIKIYSELLRELTRKKQDINKQLHLTEQIKIQADKINKMVNELNVVGKIETGNMVLQKAKVDLVVVIEEIVEVFSGLYPSAKISVKAVKIPAVECDKERISQVIENLLANAVKYSPEASEIKIRLELKDRQVLFSITDKGIGIDKKQLPQIFEKYYRTDKSKGVKGLGLGLYISKGIIDQHRGKIWAVSQPGKGSTFYFSLPVT